MFPGVVPAGAEEPDCVVPLLPFDPVAEVEPAVPLEAPVPEGFEVFVPLFPGLLPAVFVPLELLPVDEVLPPVVVPVEGFEVLLPEEVLLDELLPVAVPLELFPVDEVLPPVEVPVEGFEVVLPEEALPVPFPVEFVPALLLELPELLVEPVLSPAEVARSLT